MSKFSRCVAEVRREMAGCDYGDMDVALNELRDVYGDLMVQRAMEVVKSGTPPADDDKYDDCSYWDDDCCDDDEQSLCDDD